METAPEVKKKYKKSEMEMRMKGKKIWPFLRTMEVLRSVAYRMKGVNAAKNKAQRRSAFHSGGSQLRSLSV